MGESLVGSVTPFSFCSLSSYVFSLGFLLSALRDKSDAFLGRKLNGELVASLKVKHGCVCLANQKVAVALNNSLIAQLPTALASATSNAKADTLGFQ